jgi:hypothetical protein
MSRVTIAFLAAILAGCGASAGGDCPDAEPPKASAPTAPTGIENSFYYNQITGAGEEIPTLAYVLFEYEKEEVVKYQVAYVACTCRGPAVNYHSVAYVELSKEDGSVVFMSYDKDPSGHYSPGLYGDSTETGSGTPVRELFDRFRRERLVGATQEQIYGIEPMHGDVDGYSGATVTPNNSVTMLHGLFGYHNQRYM